MKKRSLILIGAAVLIAALLTVLTLGYIRSPLGLKPGRDYAYSIALVGDTQTTSWQYPDRLPGIYQWLLDQQESRNIRYCIGLGDIVDRHIEYYDEPFYHTDAAGNSRTYPQEWPDAAAAISQLNGRIPYALNAGNHDLARNYAEPSEEYDYTVFDADYFNDTFSGCLAYTTPDGTDCGSFEPGSVENTWRKLPLGDTTLLILCIGYNHTKDEAVLSWAEELIRQNPNCPTILTTHANIKADGENSKLWNRLISPNPNVILAASGHYNVDRVVTTFNQNIDGRPVPQILTNPTNSGDQAPVALVYFDSDNTPIGLEYYSTHTGLPFRLENQIRFR